MDKEVILQTITDIVPNLAHCKVLGITVTEASHARLILTLPYGDHLVGNPDTGIIHGGALTALMDTALGFAAVAALDDFAIAPTLDLRIDYMRPATPGVSVITEAEAYHVTSTVIFAKGIAFHAEQKDKPIAHCTASFMRLDQEHLESSSHDKHA